MWRSSSNSRHDQLLHDFTLGTSLSWPQVPLAWTWSGESGVSRPSAGSQPASLIHRLTVHRDTRMEEAVDRATEIDDPMDNVAQGMVNIGQSWATPPSRYIIPMGGTLGQTGVIPGISDTGLVAFAHTSSENGASATSDMQPVALFTILQGVYNTYPGTWDPPPGHVWNGKYWYEWRKGERLLVRSRAVPTNRRKRVPKSKSGKHPIQVMMKSR